jgi:ribosomal protein L40E
MAVMDGGMDIGTHESAAATPSDDASHCDLSTVCPECGADLLPEHAHYSCRHCGYRDSCCF